MNSQSPRTLFENKNLRQGYADPAVVRVLVGILDEAIGSTKSTSIREELKAVRAYLDGAKPTDCEGRAPDKRSFSHTEILNAFKLNDGPAVLRYLLYRYRYNVYPNTQTLGDFPIVLAVEPTSVCNLRCVMCFEADPSFTGDQSAMGYMDFGLYKSIIDEAAQHGLGSLILASRGEPTLHQKLPEMIAYARAADITEIKINTNATMLTEARSRRILAADPDLIVFSVDSADKAQFEAIRVGASFDEVVANIRSFNDVRHREFPNGRTRTRISMTIIGSQQDAVRAENFWSPLVDEFAVNQAIPKLFIYGLPKSPVERFCALLWERLYVWWDGGVNVCDEDYKSRLSVGKLGDGATIKNIWLGDKMQAYRTIHASGQKNSLHPCDRCPGFS
ncbi:MAG: radical SAM/SPASM domain-containing protein [Nitrospirae bacterium]|nr:MAG: radical SAM/SPASM domain-containing protein [Nitrospirota bacterium]